ncbi:MAG: PQQ-dependent sugar dehydrogenase, partial [Lewinella sp.]|nr:PQQ-dependent sugar dehydrogenase [Lewinella sp.]
MTTLKKLFPKKGNLLAFAFMAAFLLTSFGSMFVPLTGLYKPEPIAAFLNNNLPSTTPSNGGGPVNWSVVPAFPNLTFNNPLVITMYPDPSVDIMFVASRQGRIDYFDASNPAVTTKNLLGDFTAETIVAHDGGFLGMAFHPDFATNPNRNWVYLFYVAAGNHVFSGESVPNNGPYSCDCECFSCATDGRFYGSYLRLARYEVNGTLGTGLSIDKSSELRMINIPMFNATHRGGGLTFGNDGYLYLTIGDQARRTSAQELTKAADNGDNINMFEGGVIRLDVNIDDPSPNSHAPTYVLGPQTNFAMRDYDNNCTGGADPITYVTTETVTGAYYRIPNDNPQWYTGTSNYFEEFITVGHRNPHRMSLDKQTGALWIGEVGAGSREEINALQVDLLKRNGATTEGGGNYGWPKHEGYLVGNFTACGSNNLTLTLGTYYDPVVDFPRSGAKGANAIIGGYVYRGSKFAAQLGGKYICGGHSQNRIFAISYKTDANGKFVPDFPGGGTYRDAIEELTSFTPGQMITWGEDNKGELYIGKIGNNVNLYTLSATGVGSPAPQYLSQTGAFSDLVNMTPAPGVLPYDLVEPFWSDNAKKTRWIAVPNDGAHDTPEEKIIFSADDSWQYPAGTVLIKHFEMETSPGVFQKLETRLEVKGTDGNFYYLTYKWNAAGTDAELLDSGLEETLTVNGQPQVWYYPGTSDCQTCHQTVVGSVLGPKTRNLNRDHQYTKTGITANQLLTMSHLGIFDQTLTEADVNSFLTLAAKDDTEASLEFRARTYLDVNCSYCHQPATGNRANFDARITTPLQAQNLVNGAAMDNLGIAGATYIFPQSVGQSIIHYRMNALTEGIAMPPLAKNKVDAAGVQLIADWINSLQPTPPPTSEAGLVGNYHDGMTLQDERFTQIDANVNFNWGTGSPNATEVGTDQFSVRWTGLVRPQYSETYTFYTNSDDGVRLWINGQLLIDNWTDHAPTENSGTITLNAEEEVSLVLEFYENGGGAVMQLSWSSSSQTKQIIPAGRLSHLPSVSSGPCGGAGGNNTAPVAIFRATPTTGGFPLFVQADASASYDPNGDPVTMSWDFGDGQTGTGEQTSHLYTTPGSYYLELTITDDQGCEDTETILITVLNNGIPTVSLSATPTTGEAPLMLLFQATVSDSDGDPVTFRWDFGDG